MPLFEFKCNDCDNVFEELILKNQDDNPACPKCGNKNVEKLLSAGSVRPHGIPSGSGGYKVPKCLGKCGQ